MYVYYAMERKIYPSDVSDEEWAFAAPYLTLMIEEAPQHDYSLREIFNGVKRQFYIIPRFITKATP